MRTNLLTILAMIAFALTAAPAAAQDKDVVDTGEGIKFSKPSGWVVAKKKKGTAAALYAAGDKKSQIEFRFAEMEPDKAKQYFNTFHGSLSGAGLEKSKAGASKTYGKLKGVLTEYSSSGENPMKIYVFQFTQGKAAWLVVGMFDGKKAKNYLSDYEALLGAVVVVE